MSASRPPVNGTVPHLLNTQSLPVQRTKGLVIDRTPKSNTEICYYIVLIVASGDTSRLAPPSSFSQASTAIALCSPDVRVSEFEFGP